MVYFIISFIALILGYFIYGSFVDKVFKVRDTKDVPANTMTDGVDYSPMSTKKVVLIQLLNIAGVGPIFGPILGALYGPSALLWIVVGSIFAGGVHDYASGIISIRNGGATVPKFTEKYLGKWSRWFMRIFTLVLLLFVGVVFVMAPANLLNGLVPSVSVKAFIIIIFIYYFIATILPIQKIIGKFYPIFGAMLLVMTITLFVALALSDHGFYHMFDRGFFTNYHPSGLPIWPLLFITIACGAISGFHSTQSPMMARCITNEKQSRKVFYGSMIIEGGIALIWATLAMSFYDTPLALAHTLQGTPSAVVKEVSYGLIGGVGYLAVIAVIILPITSGDTSFRSCRLTIAEIFKLGQVKPANRLIIAIPLFIIGYFISLLDFGVVWRYFGFSNQLLSSMMLWTAAAYIAIKGGKFIQLIASLPAVFMTAACFVYILTNKTLGFGINYELSNIIGIGASVLLFIIFTYFYVFESRKEFIAAT